jgi:hypothetical protein
VPEKAYKPPRGATPTATWDTFIEAQRDGYVRYWTLDGRRWEVHGTCDRRGDCLVGVVVEGFGLIESKRDIGRAKKKLGRERIDSALDVPVTPGFYSCCGAELFTYVELEPGPYQPG